MLAAFTSLAAALATVKLEPPIIATTFEAHVRMHSPAIDNTTYFEGRVAVSADRAYLRKRETDYFTDPKKPVYSDFFLNCSGLVAYYAEAGKACVTYATRRGQCPSPYPGVHIPPDATFLRNETANALPCEVWQFYSPLFQQMVTAWVSRRHGSVLVRFLGGRVTTDYMSIALTPTADAFAVPTNCSSTPPTDRALPGRVDAGPADGPPDFPTELSASVAMVTEQPQRPPYQGSYRVWQSASQQASATYQVVGSTFWQSVQLLHATPPRLYSLTGPVGSAGPAAAVAAPTCTCLPVTPPLLPEFAPWAVAPPPSLVGRRVVDGRPCVTWRQYGYLVAGDNFTVDFEQATRLPLRWVWATPDGTRESKTYIHLNASTPLPAAFAVPKGCAPCAADATK